MEFFFYCRDKAGTAATRKQLVEQHWAFTDKYAAAMIARGPTVQDDGTTQTGSMHIVDLPDAAAARAFAYDEPYYKAGVYSEVLVRRFRNGLGRTMWQFQGDAERNQRFLVIGHGKPGMDEARNRLLDAHRAYLTGAEVAPHVILRGPLLCDQGKDWIGSAMLLEYPDRAALDTMLAAEPFTRNGFFDQVEIMRWRFGGRR